MFNNCSSVVKKSTIAFGQFLSLFTIFLSNIVELIPTRENAMLKYSTPALFLISLNQWEVIKFDLLTQLFSLS